MDEQGKTAIVEKARHLEGKQLFVKAAEAYLQAQMREEAAKAYESGGALLKAEELFGKIGKAEDAARCKKKREEEINQPTWADLQAEFQQDRGNPY